MVPYAHGTRPEHEHRTPVRPRRRHRDVEDSQRSSQREIQTTPRVTLHVVGHSTSLWEGSGRGAGRTGPGSDGPRSGPVRVADVRVTIRDRKLVTASKRFVVSRNPGKHLALGDHGAAAAGPQISWPPVSPLPAAASGLHSHSRSRRLHHGSGRPGLQAQAWARRQTPTCDGRPGTCSCCAATS